MRKSNPTNFTVFTLLLLTLPCVFPITGLSQFRPDFNFQVTQIHPSVPTDALNRPRNGPISTIAIDPNNEHNILVASESGGLFRSVDAGLHWRHEDSLPSVAVIDIAYLPDGREIVTTNSRFERRSGGVWIKRNSSAWINLANTRSIFPGPGAQCSTTPGAFDIASASDTRTLFVATDCGVAIGTPNAANWRHVEIPGTSELRAITALARGHVIVGGPQGFWYSRDGGNTWRHERTGINGVSSGEGFRGLSTDPRGGDRAYAVTDRQQLFETTNGGENWTQIDAIPSGSCGGIAFVKAVLDGSQVRLYFGNRCDTRVTTFDRNVEPTASAPSWTSLMPRHMDTRDLAFHTGTPNPFLMSSDGGLEVTTDGTNFDWISPPADGLEANQVTDVAGQYVLGADAPPNLYFTTWHNGTYAVTGSRSSGRCPEGWGLGVLRRDPAASAAPVSIGCEGHNVLTDRAFATVADWPEAAQRLLPPVMLSKGTFVQGTAPNEREPTRPIGLHYTTDIGTTWQQLAEFREELRDRPKFGGPELDPTVIQAVQTGTRGDGQQVIGLWRVSNFSDGRTPVVRQALMNRFDTMGVFPTMIWFEVYAVDPNNPAHIIAADAGANNVKVSEDGGDGWDEIPDLQNLLTHNGRYIMGIPAGDRTATLVTSISFCPDNSNRVLIGTAQGGAYFSANAGGSWRAVTGSEGITYATAFFWLDGCGKAWAGTWGRGLWEIDMSISLDLRPEILCQRCPWEKLTRELLRDEHPDPKRIQALFVFDGEVTSIKESDGTTWVSLSPGSVPVTYGKITGLKVLTDSQTAGSNSESKKDVIRGVLFTEGKMSVITGESRLEMYPKISGKMGSGKSESPANKTPSIYVLSNSSAYGMPAITDGEPLIVKMSNLKVAPREVLLVQVDGNDVAKVDSSQETFEYVDKTTRWSLGRHIIALVIDGPKGKETLWVTNFVVPHHELRALPNKR